MVKIIDVGPDPSVLKQIICKMCGAKLEYTPNDIKLRDGTDYSGGSDGKEWIICPCCDQDVTISEW